MFTEPRGGDTAPAGNRAKLNPNDTSQAVCPACGYQVAALYYDGGAQPIGPAENPPTPEEARALPRPALRFLRCLDCGHVFHADFILRTRRAGRGPWPKLLDEGRGLVLDRIPSKPTVIEAGSGGALDVLAAARPGGRYLAFDACPDGDVPRGPVEWRREPFVPRLHLSEWKPDLILVRHLLQQEPEPAGLLQSLAFAAAAAGVYPLLYIEVACADRALQSGRVEDFTHARRSLFTTESFSRLLARCFPSLDAFGHGCHDEIAYACVRLKGRAEHVERARHARGFAELAAASRHAILLELANLYLAGKQVAVWGTGGSSVAFLNAYHVDAHRFPVVVDSEESFAGSYVPAMAQRIQSSRMVAGKMFDSVIVCSPARAGEIVKEMAINGIRWNRVLVHRDGRLEEFGGTGQSFESTADLLLAAG